MLAAKATTLSTMIPIVSDGTALSIQVRDYGTQENSQSKIAKGAFGGDIWYEVVPTVKLGGAPPGRAQVPLPFVAVPTRAMYFDDSGSEPCIVEVPIYYSVSAAKTCHVHAIDIREWLEGPFATATIYLGDGEDLVQYLLIQEHRTTSNSPEPGVKSRLRRKVIIRRAMVVENERMEFGHIGGGEANVIKDQLLEGELPVRAINSNSELYELLHRNPAFLSS
ncbi:hypothetical protein CALVIDRAFT_560842 [Calocera viscosa TUFC12733]|uniref:Uncharacterized protein n=1 Tax=Calocera viscosa (strain TUFC12733) TaxID=1330018 RepID=A0A167QUD1_CALVF|nr:hypothetical protein CALVIDRAFT_560842 [Calocera viscosa TUFC12733]